MMNEELETVSSFTYIDSIVDSQESSTANINSRIGKQGKPSINSERYGHQINTTGGQGLEYTTAMCYLCCCMVQSAGRSVRRLCCTNMDTTRKQACWMAKRNMATDGRERNKEVWLEYMGGKRHR